MCKGPEAGQAYGKGEDEQKGQCSWSAESEGEARYSMRLERWAGTRSQRAMQALLSNFVFIQEERESTEGGWVQ